MKRKAKILDLLQQGPATTADVRLMCDCANGAQAITSLEWLMECGVVTRKEIPRDHSKGGRRTTSQWSLVDAANAI